MDKLNQLKEKMKNARTWKEAEITITDMMEALSEISSNGNNEKIDDSERRKYERKIERLTESNKQLMAENKRLKGNK